MLRATLLLEVAEVMRCVLRCMLEAMESGLFAGGVGRAGGGGGDALCATLYAGGCGEWILSLEASEMLEVLKVMHRVLLCMLEVICCVLLRLFEVWRCQR